MGGPRAPHGAIAVPKVHPETAKISKTMQKTTQKRNQYDGEGYAQKKTRADTLETRKIVLAPTREHDLHMLFGTRKYMKNGANQ